MSILYKNKKILPKGDTKRGSQIYETRLEAPLQTNEILLKKKSEPE